MFSSQLMRVMFWVDLHVVADHAAELDLVLRACSVGSKSDVVTYAANGLADP